MIRFAPLRTADLSSFEPQAVQAGALSREGKALVRAMVVRGVSWTVFQRLSPMHPEEVIAVGGLSFTHGSYATAWSVIGGQVSKAGWLAMTRFARQRIRDCPARRVDMMVSALHQAGADYAAALGMTYEAQLASALPDGSDALIFKRKTDHV
jgi:hypothetical protein